MREDDPARSPRTPAEPATATRDEVLGGALRTWGLFVGVFGASVLVIALSLSHGEPTAIVFSLLIGGYMILIAAAIAAFATAVMTPVVWAIMRALRRRPEFAIHLIIYMMLGVGFASLAWTVTELMISDLPTPSLSLQALAPASAVAAAVAVPLGWWLTTRKARRDDQECVLPRRIGTTDRDSAFEDRALGA